MWHNDIAVDISGGIVRIQMIVKGNQTIQLEVAVHINITQ